MEKTNNLILDLYDSAQDCSVSDFNELALSKFKESVEFNSAIIVDLAVTPDKGFFIQSLNYHGASIERFQDRQSAIGSEKIDANGSINTRDIALKSACAQPGKSMIADLKNTFSDAEILKYCKKHETAHSLTFASGRASTGLISVISLGRAKKVFQKKHGHAADILLPHIIKARKINWRLNSNISAGADGGSIALANLNGCLHFLDDKAVALLQLEWNQWVPPLLPRPLMDSLKQNQEKIFVGNAICVKASVQGKMICLVIASNSTKKSQLSSAEQCVAQLAAKGLQYKEIAKQLGVSPATIRNQLHAVYRKLGVSNKTALANALSGA